RVDANTAGTYYVLVSNNCESKRSKDYEVRIKAPIVEQRWEDVMILITNPKDNGGHTFSDIQWYQVDTDGNQIEIPGATLSYYYSNTPVEGITYVAKATDQDRRLYESCPVTGVAYDPVEKILIYPNPVKMGETITIETHFSEDDGENMRIEIISSDGQKIKSLDVTNQNISIAMPNIQGIYILQLIKGRNVYEYKVVVK
ncbi:MAG: T9SS type A sorting domain-containing protein, partial [Dysgonamonadaceae bacterium]|nr:T9SS type A sorting domain-containing protein [Dysgonamonadaceae bacterium]